MNKKVLFSSVVTFLVGILVALGLAYLIFIKEVKGSIVTTNNEMKMAYHFSNS